MICDEYLFEMRICTQLTKFIALPIFPSGVTHCESHSDPYGFSHDRTNDFSYGKLRGQS
ncbi:hypothetical protein ACHAXM_002319, partial [Skeletonema potamos]